MSLTTNERRELTENWEREFGIKLNESDAIFPVFYFIHSKLKADSEVSDASENFLKQLDLSLNEYQEQSDKNKSDLITVMKAWETQRANDIAVMLKSYEEQLKQISTLSIHQREAISGKLTLLMEKLELLEGFFANDKMTTFSQSLRNLKEDFKKNYRHVRR